MTQYESPWVAGRLLTLETRMEPCRRIRHRASRRPVATARRRRPTCQRRAAAHMRTSMVTDAIEMARSTRGTKLAGLRCHSDAGSQFTSVRYGERLAEIGAVPSIGTVGDSFDNALAETVNGYYNRAGPRPRARRPPLEDRRRPRAGHPRLGPLAQRRPTARLPRRRPTDRVRDRVLRCPTDLPTPGRNPIAVPSTATEPRAIQYRVRPLASTRMLPSLGLLATPTVVAPVAEAGDGEIADEDPGGNADVGVAALSPELVAPPPPQPAATTARAATTTGMARRRR